MADRAGGRIAGAVVAGVVPAAKSALGEVRYLEQAADGPDEADSGNEDDAVDRDSEERHVCYYHVESGSDELVPGGDTAVAGSP